MFVFDVVFSNFLVWFVAFCVFLRIVSILTMGRNKSNVCLVGKTVIVTGGNSGMGYQTSLILAGRGARVIIADKDDSTESIKKIINETGNENVVGKFIDLSDLSSVRRFAEEINKDERRLDVLINNAGVLAVPNVRTPDGLQLHMQINHFGPFLLTHLLIDLLRKSAPSRIVFVSSTAAFLSRFSLDELNRVPDIGWESFRNIAQYCNTKFCNLAASNILAEKLKGTGITCNALHPGIVATQLVDKTTDDDYNRWVKQFFRFLMYVVGKTPFEGAQSHCYLAMSDDLKNVTGKYFIACKVHFQPMKATDRKFCEEIFRRSEDFVGLNKNERL